MSNRRFIIFFICGIVCAGVLLVTLSYRGDPMAVPGRTVLVPFGPDDVEQMALSRDGMPTSRLMRTDQGRWRLTSPIHADADSVEVERLLDAVLLLRPGDSLSAADMRRMGRTLRDFGLSPPRATVSAMAGGRGFTLEFGGFTPTRAEVYARVGGDGTVFTLPVETYASLPSDKDAFRRRSVFSMPLASVVAADFRMPGATFVKLARSAGAWQIVQPDRAPAEAAAVNDVLARLLELRAERFVWSAEPEPESDTGKVKAARLASYGIDEMEGLSVGLWTSPTAVERIVFGTPAGSNLVHALVHGGSTVVAVDASVVSLCQSGRDRFLDARIFPFSADSLKSFSVTSEGTVYVLACDTNGQWRIASPVAAPADSAAVAELVGRILRLRQNDRVAEGAPSAMVAVTAGSPAFPAATNLAAVAVRPDFLAAPANLRSKRMLSVPAASVRRLTVVSAGGETVVEHDVERSAWRLVKTPAPSDKVGVSGAGVSRLLAALAEVTAVSVENLNATPEDFKRCGLVRPAFTIAVDVDSADAVRRNLLLGSAAPGGGRYATAGGADAIFIVSRETVASLTAPLAESELGGTAAESNKEGKGR